eukprot:3907173-Pyramimonas_sp.AAC.1
MITCRGRHMSHRGSHNTIRPTIDTQRTTQHTRTPSARNSNTPRSQRVSLQHVRASIRMS